MSRVPGLQALIPVRRTGDRSLWWSSACRAGQLSAPCASPSAWCGNTAGPAPSSAPPSPGGPPPGGAGRISTPKTKTPQTGEEDQTEDFTFLVHNGEVLINYTSPDLNQRLAHLFIYCWIHQCWASCRSLSGLVLIIMTLKLLLMWFDSEFDSRINFTNVAMIFYLKGQFVHQPW